jgi:UDP-glucose 4-epimerase
VIVVTGGLGFIGNELVRRLAKKGEEVVIVDNKDRVAPDIHDIRSLRTEVIDITDYERITTLFSAIRPEIVFHLAALHFIPECNANPERTLRINVEGTQSVLRASLENKVKKFLFASSGAVYADHAKPLDESSALAPVDIYGWSKLFAEQLCKWFSSKSEMKIMACRLFNNYGPRETNAHIIPEIIDQLKKGSTLSLGNIKPVRDYIHTSDCAEALIRLSVNCNEKFSIVNVGSGQGYSVEQLIEKIEVLLARKIKVVTDETKFRSADKLVQLSDIGTLRERTQWSPGVKIDEGLKHLLMYEGLIH